MMQEKSEDKRKKHPGRKGLEISLEGVDFDEAVEALLETPPPPKEEPKKSKQKKK